MSKRKNSISQKKAKLIIPRVKVAIENEFYLEACYLISLAVEARLRTLIAKNDHAHPGAGYTFEQCLKRMKFLLLKLKDVSLSRNISIELMDGLRTWKNQRNLLLKAIESSHVSKRRIQSLALEGKQLMDQLNAGYKSYKNDWKRTFVDRPVE
jgi:hypothetical protein